jgi:hypothetical protein
MPHTTPSELVDEGTKKDVLSHAAHRAAAPGRMMWSS